MITTSTVFVLGAGAHVPYGFPTAATLKDRIVSLLSSGYDGWTHVTLRNLGYDSAEVEVFRDRFRRSPLISIDRFLEIHKSDVEMVSLGKSLIAMALMPLEDPSIRLEPQGRAITGDWLEYLLNRMHAPTLAQFVTIKSPS